MKVCSKCGKEKELSEFCRKTSSKDGYNGTCKQCRIETELKRYYANKEKIITKRHERYQQTKDMLNKRRREQYKNDDVIREKIKRESREYGRKNREKKLKYMQQEYYPKKRKERLKYLEQWRNLNRKKISDGLKRYRESEAGKIADSKKHARRKRQLGFNIVFKNNIAEPIAWHHLDNKNVIALPRDIHEFFTLNNTEYHRENLNSIVKQLYPKYKWNG